MCYNNVSWLNSILSIYSQIRHTYVNDTYSLDYRSRRQLCVDKKYLYKNLMVIISANKK